MKAVKDNKIYKVNEVSKSVYLSQGFDIVDDNGNIVESSKAKTVPYDDYEKLLVENKKLKAENAKLKKADVK